MSTTLNAPCKINLFLHIAGVREDGYHELNTLFLPVPSPGDTLEISPADSGMVIVCPEFPELETKGNLLHKAWDSFGRNTGFRPGIRVRLTKYIPMGAGLGGGSTDAAALLKWLNTQAGGNSLGKDALIALAARLGADIPFFLQDRPCLARGIGEDLTPVDPGVQGLHLLLVCPPVHVNTQWAYARWDALNAGRDVALRPRLTSWESNNKNSLPVQPQDVFNDFETPVFEKHPELRAIKDKLLDSGAIAAAMSGSGSTVFGLFRHEREAAEAARAFGKDAALLYMNRY